MATNDGSRFEVLGADGWRVVTTEDEAVAWVTGGPGRMARHVGVFAPIATLHSLQDMTTKEGDDPNDGAAMDASSGLMETGDAREAQSSQINNGEHER